MNKRNIKAQVNQMKNNSKSTLAKDIEVLLSNYLGKKEAEDFCSELDYSNSILQPKNTESVAGSINQINSFVPDGSLEREFIQGILTLAENRISEDYLFKLMLDLGQLMIFNGELSLAIEIQEDLLSKIDGREQYFAIEADAYLALANIYWSQAYWEQSIQYVQKSYEIYRVHQNPIGYAKCENLLGTIFGEQGDILEAHSHFMKGLGFLREVDDPLLRSMFEVNLGILYNMQGEYAKAMWNFKNALQKFIYLKDTRRVARVRHNLGILYTKIKDYQAAIEEFDKSISISLEHSYLSNCAIGYIGKAFIYTKLENMDLAEAFTDKALEISFKINDALSIADIYKIKGMIQNNLNNFELSEEMFENSIRLNEDFDNKFNQAESKLELSGLYAKENKAQEAEELRGSAMGYYNLIKAKSYIDEMISAQFN